MNKEDQNIEYKQSWHDEYLKWLCGFANAQGGKLIIGVDDDGNAVGMANAKKLLENIPNKIRDTRKGMQNPLEATAWKRSSLMRQ